MTENLDELREKIGEMHSNMFKAMLKLNELPELLLRRYFMVKTLLDKIDGRMSGCDLVRIALDVGLNLETLRFNEPVVLKQDLSMYDKASQERIKAAADGDMVKVDLAAGGEAGLVVETETPIDPNIVATATVTFKEAEPEPEVAGVDLASRDLSVGGEPEKLESDTNDDQPETDHGTVTESPQTHTERPETTTLEPEPELTDEELEDEDEVADAVHEANAEAADDAIDEADEPTYALGSEVRILEGGVILDGKIVGFDGDKYVFEDEKGETHEVFEEDIEA